MRRSSEKQWGAAALRQRTLAAWAADPATIGRDAAAEAELAHVSHAGRVVVELLQNAADAVAGSHQGDTPCARVTFVPHDDGTATLRVSNSGAPLDAAGLAAMASLRGSTKVVGAGSAVKVSRPQVGRFGVGFAAVAGVSDRCTVSGASEAVLFDRDMAQGAVAELGRHAELACEATSSAPYSVPILRLPFETEPSVEPGFVTTVDIAVRSDAAHAVAQAVQDIGDWCLIALPALTSLDVVTPRGTTTFTNVEDRWLIERSGGVLSAEAAATLPGVRAADTHFTVAVAVPKSTESLAAQAVSGTLLAPTPTGVALDWPMLCVAGVPVDEARRRVLPGPATDEVVALLGATAAAAIERHVRDGGQALPYIPVGVAASAVDAAARAHLLAALRHRPIVREDNRQITPDEACMLAEPELAGDEEWVGWLATSVPGLVTVPYASRAAAVALSVRTIDISDALEGFAWPASETPGRTWRDFAAATAARLTKPGVRGALGGMLVPTERADGGERLAPVGSDVVLADAVSSTVRSALVEAGVKCVRADISGDPHAVSILTAGGAKILRPEDVLWRNEVAAWALRPTDDDDDAESTGLALLEMVSAATESETSTELFADTHTHAERAVSLAGFAWLRGAEFRGASGDLNEAWTLVAPESTLASWVSSAAAEPIDADLYGQYSASVWRAFGVLGTLEAADLRDASAEDIAEWEWVDGADEWCDDVGVGTILSGSLIAGLDLIDPEHLGQALQLIDADPALRTALTEPLRIAGPDGEFTASSPSAWWLARDLGCEGAGAGELTDWFGDTIPELHGISSDVAAALGAATTFEALTVDGWQALFDALEDEPDVQAWQVRDFWAALTHAAPTLLAPAGVVEPPVVLPMAVGGQVLWCDPREVWAAEDEFWRARRDVGEIVAVPRGMAGAVAAATGAGLVTGADAGVVTSQGTPREVPARLQGLARSVPASVVVHEELLVDEVPVPWWVDVEGLPHADERHIAEALAYASDAWHLRDEFRAALR